MQTSDSNPRAKNAKKTSKVWLVWDEYGEYSDYSKELRGVFETEHLATDFKAVLDTEYEAVKAKETWADTHEVSCEECAILTAAPKKLRWFARMAFVRHGMLSEPGNVETHYLDHEPPTAFNVNDVFRSTNGLITARACGADLADVEKRFAEFWKQAQEMASE